MYAHVYIHVSSFAFPGKICQFVGALFSLYVFRTHIEFKMCKKKLSVLQNECLNTIKCHIQYSSTPSIGKQRKHE